MSIDTTAEDAREAEACTTTPVSAEPRAAAQRLMSSWPATSRASTTSRPTSTGWSQAVNANIDGCDAVGVTVVMEDRPRTAAYTTAGTLEIDAVQYCRR